MRNPETSWESENIAARLLRLQSGEGSVLGIARRTGLVRARCLLAERLWEIQPYQGSVWRWLMIGETSTRRWSVVFADGANPPETIRDSELTAHGALWDATEFLRWDL